MVRGHINQFSANANPNLARQRPAQGPYEQMNGGQTSDKAPSSKVSAKAVQKTPGKTPGASNQTPDQPSSKASALARNQAARLKPTPKPSSPLTLKNSTKNLARSSQLLQQSIQQSVTQSLAQSISCLTQTKLVLAKFIPAKLDLTKLDPDKHRDALLQALPQKTWKWPLICLTVLGGFGGTGLLAYLWLAGLPPLPDCRSTTALSPDHQRLYCAQDASRSGNLEDLVDSIKLVKDWSPNHPLYSEAQRSLERWSRQVMQVAREKMHQNDFKGASEALGKIPANSPIYEEAQKTLANWQQQWQAGEAIYTKAVDAMNRQEWREAFDQVTELGYLEHDYWRLQQADALSKQISVQKKAQESIKQAKKLAKKLTPEQMGEAIVLLQEIPPETGPWTEAQSLLADWSQNLLKIAFRYWQDGDGATAIRLAQQVPLDLKLSNHLSDLVKYSHAAKLVEESQGEGRSWKQLWSLMEATTAVEQISSGSPVYTEAQVQLKNWQAQLQDAQQLQVATMVADLDQKSALSYAVAQARQIDPSRQRYSQAQALVTRWLLQIEQLEDSPYLKRAEQLGAEQTVSALQQAIAQAQVIPNQRSLWNQAQSQIVVWQRQIEKLEDQPVMERALALAKANQLEEAIVTAAEIRPNRALYDQAQSSIATWKDKISMALVAEDQALMDRAYGLAGNGDITGGIAIAAQLSPGRPLYMEAQSVIGAWLKERDGDNGADSGASDPENSSSESSSSEGVDESANTVANSQDSASASNQSAESASDLSETEATSEAVE
jgi:hypothetical protein